MIFTKPTLVTITAPTCAGKSFLMEELEQVNGLTRLVSTTDRAPRHNEREGVDYFFISTAESQRLEREDLFAELVTYNGVRYGVTHQEMEGKMSDLDSPPMVILEPSGLEIYRRYCASKGWGMFSIFVSTVESIRLERLVDRTTSDLMRVVGEFNLDDDQAIPGRMNYLQYKMSCIVEVNNKRLKAVLDQERLWQGRANWDVVVDGTDVVKAVRDIGVAIKSRNARSAVYA